MARDDMKSPLLFSDDNQVVLSIKEELLDETSQLHGESNHLQHKIEEDPLDEPSQPHHGSNNLQHKVHGVIGRDRHFNLQNPYRFLGVNGFTVPPSTTIDPFRNQTPRIEGVYEWLKIVVCLPIALIRVLLFGTCLLVGYLATKIALLGWEDRHNPMPKWRCRIMCVTRVAARCILFCFGYHWIRRKGRPVSREVAPIVVSNHVSYIDPIFYFYELFPTIVASESHDSIPFVGTIIRAMQVIYVNRFSPSSRKQAIDEIRRKASFGKFPRLLLFPEGTTTNGRVLISFRNGAFIPGFPIQPVAVRYPHVHFDQSWGQIGLMMLMCRMFTQFHNFMEVEYLPVVSPLEHRKESALQFSKRTSHAIATALNVVQTNHSYGDLMLLTRANQSCHGDPSQYLVEMARVESSLHISSFEAVDFLDKFLSMNPDPSGCVNIHDFLRVLRLKPCDLSEKIFGFLDLEKNGRITFKQFLFGSAHVMRQTLFQSACEFAYSGSAAGQDCISMEELRKSICSAIPDLDHDEIHKLFDLFDCDGDGQISREDFNTCTRKNPLLIALFMHQLQNLSEEGSNDLWQERMVGSIPPASEDRESRVMAV